MLEDLRQRLAQTREKMRERDRLAGAAAQAEETLRAEYQRRDALRAVLQKEGRDVEKLEGLSLAALFHAVLGDKPDQLKKEKEEYLQAKLRHDACQSGVEHLRQEFDGMEKRLAALGNPAAEYAAVLAEKEAALRESGGPEGRALVELEERLADLRADRKELGEALGAGRAALSSLEGVRACLRSASNWGAWDMLGGGLIATHVKHTKIDEARARAHTAQAALSRFQRECRDVRAAPHIGIEVGSFATFADYFFDGLIADWFVQSKIHGSLESTDRAIAGVEAALRRLERRAGEVQEPLDAVEAERRRRLEEA
jgi:hypothetical protein